jgi:hypothetical protein
MEQEKELIELFRKMDRETKDMYLSHGRIALVAEESARRSILNMISRRQQPEVAPIRARRGSTEPVLA